MPKKGRNNPCQDPLKRGKHAGGSDVNSLNEKTTTEFRRKLPDYEWPEKIRMCGSCRGMAYRMIDAREKARAVLHDIGSTVREVFQAGNGEGMDVDSAFSREATNNTAEDDNEQMDTEQSSQTFSNDGNHHYALKENSDAEIPETPTAPQADSIVSGERIFPLLFPATPSASSQSATPSASTPFSSVSLAPTVSSVQSGSVFHDEKTAKYNLTMTLQHLKVPLPEGVGKTQKKKLRDLMNRSSSAIKSLFVEYTGDASFEEDEPNDCKQCKKIVDAVTSKIGSVTTKKEVYQMLTSLPSFITIKRMHEEIGVTEYRARLASQLRAKEGPFSFPNLKTTGNPLPARVRDVVIQFYLSDENSIASPNARDTVLVRKTDGTKERVAKRHMCTNLKETYKELRRTIPDISIGISKFAELRPRNCTWPGPNGIYRSCTCVIHQNFFLMMEGLKIASVDDIEHQFENEPAAVSFMALMDDSKELINYLLCEPPTEECYLGYCEACPHEIHMGELLRFSEGMDITYKFWINNDLTTMTEDSMMFSQRFPTVFLKFSEHDFIYRKQKEFVKEIKTGSLGGGRVAVVTVDYGENFPFYIQDAIQGFHWNNKQATVHPFVVYVASSIGGPAVYKTYFVISDELTHDATTFHVFRESVVPLIQRDFPHVTHIDYVSDGAGSQYKNFKNIGNLLFHEEDFKLTARWIFTATSHGKSTCDAMSAVVKRTVRLRSLRATNPIDTAEKMFKVASDALSSPTLEFVYVKKIDIDLKRPRMDERYNLLRKVPAIRKNHYFEVGPNKMLISKRYASSENSERFEIIITPDEEEVDQLEDSNPNVNSKLVPAVGSFYAARCAQTYQVGCAVDVSVEEAVCNLRMMKKKGRGGISLVWPPADKLQEVMFADILMKITEPVFNDGTGNYRMEPTELATVREKLATQ